MEGMKKKKNIAESQNWKEMQGKQRDIEYFKRNAELAGTTVSAGYPSCNMPPSQVNVYVPATQMRAPEEFNTMQMMFATRQPQQR